MNTNTNELTNFTNELRTLCNFYWVIRVREVRRIAADLCRRTGTTVADAERAIVQVCVEIGARS